MRLKIRHSHRLTKSSLSLKKHRRPALASVMVAALLICISSAAAQISFVLKWGSTGGADGQFLTPTGITTDNAGNVYVAEGNGNRAQKFDSNGNFLLKFGIPGDVNGGFVSPSGVAVDSLGNIYVSDAFTNRISKFDSGGNFVLTWGGFLSATGVAVDSADNVYVSDSGNHRISKFTSAGTFITQWGSSGTGDGQFNSPQGLAVDLLNNVYVADTANHRIQKFTSTGTFITKWGSNGTGDGQFDLPAGVGADSLGNVYVADTNNSRIQRFSSTGTFIETFGSPGSGDGQFAGPQDVAADATGNIYVADTGNDRVQKLSITAVAVVADAGADQTLECAGALTMVTLDGTGSTGGGTLSYTWEEGATQLGTGAMLAVSLPTGSHTITLTVTDSGGGSDDDTVIINIVDTTAPQITLNGPDPMTVECHSSFVDPGATASDGCAGDLTGAITVSGSVNPNVVGTYMLTYMVSDGFNSSSVTRTVNVVDTTAPTITVNGQTITLWPPNHNYHTMFVGDFVTGASDGCDSSVDAGDVVISQVSSDEPEDGNGDGNTLNDIVIAADCKSVQLRAERAGNLNGRVYTITFKITDAAGNVSTATAKVTVPKSQGSGAAVDDGPNYIVAGNCP